MALTTAFAKNGNRKAVPQSTADGSVSYEQGFGNLYALPPEEGGLFIDRAQFNQIMYDTTSAVISNQNSINTLNSSVNTLNTKVANIESGVTTGVVNLTTNQTIGGIKTFSVPPVSATNPSNNNQVANKAYVDTVGNTAVKLTGAQTIQGVKTFSSIPISATQPTNANQVANKAYVDAIAATKANFITASVRVGTGEAIKNLSEFQAFAQNNFAHYYTIVLTSNIEEDTTVILRGLNLRFSSTEYTITFKQPFDFQFCTVFFGKIGLKIDSQTAVRITFLSSQVYINGNLTFTDLVPASAVTTEQSSAILLYGSNVSTGGDDDWNVTTTARNFIGITHSRAGLINITFTGNIANGKTLFNFELQGILMTQACVFNNLSVASITQNQLTNKGIWFNV